VCRSSGYTTFYFVSFGRLPFFVRDRVNLKDFAIASDWHLGLESFNGVFEILEVHGGVVIEHASRGSQ
jgi:hypothetical protein